MLSSLLCSVRHVDPHELQMLNERSGMLFAFCRHICYEPAVVNWAQQPILGLRKTRCCLMHTSAYELYSSGSASLRWGPGCLSRKADQLLRSSTCISDFSLH